MRSLKLLCLFAACMVAISAQGQPYNKLQPGEKMPDAAFTILKDGVYKTARLSDYKGRLLILDYWNIWCGSCIEAFPKLTALQAVYGDKVTILPVSFINTKEQVLDFVNKRKGTPAAVKLPLGIFESTNNPLFRSVPTIGYPREVWIDASGTFLGASDAVDVTKENVELALKSMPLPFKSRNFQMNFKATKPLLTNNNGGPDTTFSYRSLIAGYIDSLGGLPTDNSVTKNRLHLLYANRLLIELLKISVKKGISDDIYNQWVVVEGSPGFKEKLYPDLNNRNWRVANSYCYDLFLPATFTRPEAYSIMVEDLERYFRLSAAMERRMMQCLVLKRTDTVDRLKSEGKLFILKEENGRLELAGVNMEALRGGLSMQGGPIVLDETGYDGKIDLSLKLGTTFNLDFLNQQLKKYGLKLESAERELIVVVIKEKV